MNKLISLLMLVAMVSTGNQTLADAHGTRYARNNPYYSYNGNGDLAFAGNSDRCKALILDVDGNRARLKCNDYTMTMSMGSFRNRDRVEFTWVEINHPRRDKETAPVDLTCNLNWSDRRQWILADFRCNGSFEYGPYQGRRIQIAFSNPNNNKPHTWY